MGIRTWVLTTGAVALTLTACSAVVPPAGAAEPLERFADCDAYLSHVQEEVAPYVGPWGLDGGGYPGARGVPERMFTTEQAVGDVNTSTAAPEAGSEAGGEADGTPAYSGTNVQEVGIDEPDLVKTDGERILVVDRDGTLHAVEVTETGEPVARGTVDVGPGAHSLFLTGDRATVISDGYAGAEDVPGAPVPQGPSTVLTEVDLTTLDDPRVTGQLRIDGSYVNARLHDGTARVVLRSGPPTLGWTQPQGDTSRDYEAATERNRAILSEASASDLLPGMTLTAPEDSPGAEALPVVDCANVLHPAEFAGPGLLTVVAVDLTEDLDVDHTVSVMADGDTVYASDTGLYVAFSNWKGAEPIPLDAEEPVPSVTPALETEVHAFDVSTPTATDYSASGAVRGTLLNQFALSEHEGILRVATTDQDAESGRSESFVTTLRRDGDRLEQLGQVGGLGPDEEIQAVRYIGDTAYVVTFRQTDPLYTVDLSDPAAPEVVGELKILGYSAYLHPVDTDRLLGVGQDATEEGFRLGSQVSLFDVSDPASPTRVDQHGLEEGSSSEVEWDHKAFLWWPETGTAVVPFTRWGGFGGGIPEPAIEGIEPAPAIREAPALDETRSVEDVQSVEEPSAAEDVPAVEEPPSGSTTPGDTPDIAPTPIAPTPPEPLPQPVPDPLPEPLPQPLPEPMPQPVPVEPISGALVLSVDTDGLTEIGTILWNDAASGTVRRSLVIGDTLYTVWDGGITASSLDDLRGVGQVVF